MMREQNFPLQEAAWLEEDYMRTATTLRLCFAWLENCTSWYRLWGMILTILFNLAWGNRGKRLSGQVQADL